MYTNILKVTQTFEMQATINNCHILYDQNTRQNFDNKSCLLAHLSLQAHKVSLSLYVGRSIIS